MRFNSCDVTRPVKSVADMVDANYTVIFSPNYSGAIKIDNQEIIENIANEHDNLACRRDNNYWFVDAHMEEKPQPQKCRHSPLRAASAHTRRELRPFPRLYLGSQTAPWVVLRLTSVLGSS